MTINEITQEIHKNAVEHGWWDEPRGFGEVIALCHSELSEALEEDRAGRGMLYCKTGMQLNAECRESGCVGIECFSKGVKPEGVAVEMIDCLIRILDWCGSEGVDVEAVLALKHEYNKSRPYKHGKKY